MVSFGGGITDRLSFDLSASYESQARSYTVGKNNFLKTTALENAILDPTKKGAGNARRYLWSRQGECSLRLSV